MTITALDTASSDTTSAHIAPQSMPLTPGVWSWLGLGAIVALAAACASPTT